MGQLTDRHCHNLPAGSSHKLLTLKSCLWRHQTKSHRPLRQTQFDHSSFGWCPHHQTQLRASPGLLGIQRASCPLGVCLSSCSATAPLTTEIFKRRHGDGGMGWDFSEKSDTINSPKSGLRLQEYLLQPSANRDHPLWSSGTVCPSLVCTVPGLPWSRIARHLLAAATSDRFSACHAESPRSSSLYLKWHELTALSCSLHGCLHGHCHFCMGLLRHQGSSFPAGWSQGTGPGARRTVWEAFPSPTLVPGYSPGCSSVFLTHFSLLPTKAHFLRLISEAVGDADVKPVL